MNVLGVVEGGAGAGGGGLCEWVSRVRLTEKHFICLVVEMRITTTIVVMVVVVVAVMIVVLVVEVVYQRQGVREWGS